MRNMFDAKAERPIINALFIQPTYYCAGNCKGCYVKAHKRSGPQVSVEEMAKLFKQFYLGIGAECNQITISMDMLPEDNRQHREWMIDFAQDVRLAQLEITPNGDIPEVHMTFRNLDSLLGYNQYISYFLGQVDVISLSQISVKELDYLHHLKVAYPKLKINYNHMSPEVLWTWDLHVHQMKQIVSVVDSVYLIAQKTPLGTDRDLLMVARDNKRMYHDITYFKKLREDVGCLKFIVDGCVKDVINFELEGYGCSSNISRFQVWPDGSVSGCPYAIEGTTPSASTAEGIIQNIRKARETYDWSRCHLPSTYRSLSPKAK